jgi:hypothetical protein
MTEGWREDDRDMAFGDTFFTAPIIGSNVLCKSEKDEWRSVYLCHIGESAFASV